jgi:hypothetical protein
MAAIMRWARSPEGIGNSPAPRDSKLQKDRSLEWNQWYGFGVCDRIGTVMQQPIWNFEQEPFADERPDETSINLRAYFDRMPDEKMRQYQPGWSDQQVIEWCGDFRDDGALMIACCERDVDVHEFRRALERAIAYRNRVRPKLVGAGK